MVKWADLNEDAAAEISRHVDKHWSNSTEWLKHTIAEYFGCRITSTEVLHLKSAAARRECRNDSYSPLLKNYDEWH